MKTYELEDQTTINTFRHNLHLSLMYEEAERQFDFSVKHYPNNAHDWMDSTVLHREQQMRYTEHIENQVGLCADCKVALPHLHDHRSHGICLQCFIMIHLPRIKEFEERNAK